MAEPDQDTVQTIVDNRPYGDVTAADVAASQKRQPLPQSLPKLQFSQTPQLRQYDAPTPEQYQLGPNQRQGTPFDAFKDPMLVLAGLSSLFTRHPLMGAMNYAAGAMRGYNQGQTQVFEENKQKFDEAMKATIEQNRTELNRYQAAWDWKKDSDFRKTIPQLYAEAVRNKDQLLMAAIQSGDPSIVFKVLEGRDAAQNGLIRATELAQIRADIQAQAKYGDTPQAAASNIVDGMERGDQPPTTQGLGQLTGPVRNEASKRKFDLAKAQLEWLRAQLHMRSLSGPNITKYFALSESVKNTIDEVLELSQQLKLGNYPAKNRADLIWLTQTKGGTPEGDLAVRYLGAIKTLKEEFANLAQGGGVPTEPAWSLANEQINQDFGVSALDASLKEVRRLIGFRVEAIKNTANQPYNPAGTPTAPSATGGGGTSGSVIQYDSQGNRVQ